METSPPGPEGTPGSTRRGRGRPANRGAGETRTAIVLAAQRLFGRHGYHGVTVEAIAVETGLNTRALYHHFGSKRDLFEAARADVFAHITGEARDRIGRATTNRERLTGYLDVYRQVHEREPHVLPFLGMALVDGLALSAHRGQLAEAGDDLRSLLETFVGDAIEEDPRLPDLDPGGTFSLLAAVSMGLSLMSLGDPAAFRAMLDAADRLLAVAVPAPDHPDDLDDRGDPAPRHHRPEAPAPDAPG